MRSSLFPAILFSLNALASAAVDSDLLWNSHRAANWSIFEGKIEDDDRYSLEGEYPLRLFSDGSGVVIYRYEEVDAESFYRVDFSYMGKLEEAGRLSVAVAFNGPDGKNGGLGKASFRLPATPPGTEWIPFHGFFLTPPQIERIQFSVSLGLPAQEAWISPVRVSKEAEYEIPVLADLNQTPTHEMWEKAPPLNGFWRADQNAEFATAQTEVRLIFGEKALYVRFVNEEENVHHLHQKVTERDGPVWNDDDNELFISIPGGVTRQFAVGAGGGMWDGTLYQKAAGDPWVADSSWNGTWTATVTKGEGSWSTSFVIPYEDLGTTPEKSKKWGINFSRSRKAGISEHSTWGYYTGNFNEVSKYSTLEFSPTVAWMKRYVERIEETPLKIVREKPTYHEVLGDKKGGFHFSEHSSTAYINYLRRQAPALAEKYTEEQWAELQERYLDEYGYFHIDGPYLPWVNSVISWERLHAAHRRTGIRFPYVINSSANDKEARDQGAIYYDTKTGHVATMDPKYIESVTGMMRRFLSQNKEHFPIFGYIRGIDEPTNPMFTIFSRTLQPWNSKVLDEVDREIREGVGGGKFGLYDYYNPVDAEQSNAPFRRIAFVRWWNDGNYKAGKAFHAVAKELAPDQPFISFNTNTVSGLTLLDLTLAFEPSDWTSVDPYPTSTYALYGKARALYHTGFSTKIARDLSGKKTTRVYLQGFNYHHRAPTPDDLREWTSQAIKNGATRLNWYTEDTTRLQHPEMYPEMQRLSYEVYHLPEVKIPKETKTAIFHSFTTHSAVDDQVAHASYSVYTMLGEGLGSWFDFVGERQTGSLDDYQLIYLPQGRYMPAEAAQALLRRVENGAFLVVFDPLAFEVDPLGERHQLLQEKLIGVKLGGQRGAAHLLAVQLPGVGKGATLPLTPVSNQAKNGLQAFDIIPPEDAKVVATYPDGKPAAFLREVGKGKVLYFAAQPFGNSNLSIEETPWIKMMEALAKEVSEPLELPIWRFLLPRSEKEHPPMVHP